MLTGWKSFIGNLIPYLILSLMDFCTILWKGENVHEGENIVDEGGLNLHWMQSPLPHWNQGNLYLTS